MCLIKIFFFYTFKYLFLKWYTIYFNNILSSSPIPHRSSSTSLSLIFMCLSSLSLISSIYLSISIPPPKKLQTTKNKNTKIKIYKFRKEKIIKTKKTQRKQNKYHI